MSPAPSRGQTRNTAPCLRCERDRRIHARGLCTYCYRSEMRRGNLDRWPLAEIGVDDVLVDRAAAWLIQFYENTGPAQRRQPAAAGRPDLNRNEKIAVLNRVSGAVPPYVAVEVLGIGGRYSRRYLEQAGVLA